MTVQDRKFALSTVMVIDITDSKPTIPGSFTTTQ